MTAGVGPTSEAIGLDAEAIGLNAHVRLRRGYIREDPASVAQGETDSQGSEGMR